MRAPASGPLVGNDLAMSESSDDKVISVLNTITLQAYFLNCLRQNLPEDRQ